MCYLCGTKRSKAIQAALKVWGRKSPGTEQERQQEAARRFHPSCRWAPTVNPIGWDMPPKRDKRWTARDFEEYQRRTRYHFLPGTRPV